MSQPEAGAAAGDRGTLIVLGGHEDRAGDRLIPRAVAARAERAALVVVTAASNLPGEPWGDYEPVFRDLGVDDVRHLHVDTRQDAHDPERLRLLDGAAAVFFTRGNQLKLAGQLGDTPVDHRVRALYAAGGCVAGTSADASVVTETMLVTGNSAASPHVEDALRMAPGFGLLPGVIVDQHFAERGRIGRLIGAVAQNPRLLGVGIDEDAAVVCDGGARSPCSARAACTSWTGATSRPATWSRTGATARARCTTCGCTSSTWATPPAPAAGGRAGRRRPRPGRHRADGAP